MLTYLFTYLLTTSTGSADSSVPRPPGFPLVSYAASPRMHLLCYDRGTFVTTTRRMAAELFTTSITSRRFPALRALTADDVEVMALPQRPTPDRKAKPAAAGKGSRLFDPDLVKPSAVTNLSPMAGARSGLDAGRAIAGSTTSKDSSPMKQQEPRPTWRPGGKTHHSLVPEHGYVMMHSPFDMGFRQRQQERLAAASMRLAGGFHPPSASQAKGDVSVNYYLNSADAETLEAERRWIQEKARAALPNVIHTRPRRAPLA